MNTSTETPLVRDQHGATLGIDWRRTEMSPIEVPGRVAVEVVMPGDSVRVGRVSHVVLSKRAAGPVMHLVMRTAEGAPIVQEYAAGSYVEVTAVGAFDK